jgi:tetratricopeptide (TPR) repeat protein
MKTRLLIVCILAVLAPVKGVVAAPIQEWFEKANTFYEQQQFDSAATYYGKIAQVGQSVDVCYNLGNTYYRLGKTGPALLYYEKAQKIDPTDPDILANIRFANMNIIDRLPQPEETFMGTLVRGLHTRFSLSTQLWILFAVLMVISILFSASIYVSHNMRLWLIYAGSLGLILALAGGISVGTKIYSEERVNYAIVLSKAVDAMSEPNRGKIQFTAHEGTRFRIRQQVNEWSFVSLPNGVCGWVPDSSFGKI